MQQRSLGPRGPQVGAVGLGNHPLATYNSRPPINEAATVYARAAEFGMTLWDTADAYCQGEADVGYGERLAAAALALLPPSTRHTIVIATKGGTVRPGGRWLQDGRPEHLRAAIDASLKSLGAETIALYQLHCPDSKVPFADSIGALAEARDNGKIREIGISNVTAAQIEEANAIVPIASVQNAYSLGVRDVERNGVLDKCRELGLAFLPFSPFGGVESAKSLADNGALAAISAELGVSPYRVVLAWLLQKYGRVIAIPGIGRLASAQDCAQADSLKLPPDAVARLDTLA